MVPEPVDNLLRGRTRDLDRAPDGVSMLALVARHFKRIGRFNLFMLLSFAWEHGINKLVVMPFLARHLGESKFGSFVLAMSIALFLAAIIPSGIFMTNYRENARFDDEGKREFFDTVITLLLSVAIVAALLYGVWRNEIASLFDDPSMAAFIPLLGGYMVCYIVFNAGKQILTVELRFGTRTAFDVLYGLFICMLVPGYFVFGEIGVSGGYFLGSLVSATALLIYLRRQRLISTVRLVGNKLRVISRSALTFTVASAALVIMTLADRWIVGAFWQEAQVTYYYVAVQIAALFVLPVSLLVSVLNPIVTTRSGLADFRPEERRLFFTTLVASMLGFLLLGWFAGPLVIRILYGDNILANSLAPFRVVLLGQVVYLLRVFSQPFMTKFFPPQAARNMQWTSAGMFLILHLGLVPKFGIIGAATATACSFALLGALSARLVLAELSTGLETNATGIK